MKYWIKYRNMTGLGAPVLTKWFATILERYNFYKAGVEVISFGQRGM